MQDLLADRFLHMDMSEHKEHGGCLGDYQEPWSLHNAILTGYSDMMIEGVASLGGSKMFSMFKCRNLRSLLLIMMK